MNKATALKKLARLLGPKMLYSEHPDALVGEARETAEETWRELRAVSEAASNAADARRKEVLANDAEYQRLCNEYRIARKRMDEAYSLSRHRRVQVGRDSGLFFHVMVEADNWQEAVDAIKAQVTK